MKEEIKIFFTALMFFTRIPCPKWVNHDPEYLNKSSIYLPLIGVIVALPTSGIYYLSQYIGFPNEISVILSIITSILITGAFHEDGFADVCDGFGGGWTKSKILDIMKDSRVGTYGLVGLTLLILLKFFFLTELRVTGFLIVSICAHVLSRYTALTFIYFDEYAREDLQSKAKPLATKISNCRFLFATIFALLSLLIFQSVAVFLVLIPLLVLRLYFSWYFKKWIGGYTGDCLGAVQQMSEVIIYACIYLLFHHHLLWQTYF